MQIVLFSGFLNSIIRYKVLAVLSFLPKQHPPNRRAEFAQASNVKCPYGPETATGHTNRLN